MQHDNGQGTDHTREYWRQWRRFGWGDLKDLCNGRILRGTVKINLLFLMKSSFLDLPLESPDKNRRNFGAY